MHDIRGSGGKRHIPHELHSARPDKERNRMKFLTIGYIVWRTGAGKTPSVHLQSLDVKWVQRTGADRK